MRAHLTVLLALAACSAAAAADVPPIASFTDYAQYESMKVSPQGTYLAVTRRMATHEEIIVLRMPGREYSGGARFGDLMDIETFHWANDSRLLISPARRFPGHISYKAPTGEIIGLNANGKGGELLFGYQAGQQQVGTRLRQRESLYTPATVLSRLPADPDNVLIQTWGYGIEGDFNQVYRMNVLNGRLVRVAGSPLRKGTFVRDQDYRIALVAGEDFQGRDQVYWRAPGTDEWKLLINPQIGTGLLWPLAHTGKDGEFYVLDDRDAPTRGVFRWTPATGAQQLLFRHADADLGSPSVDPSGKPWVFEYFDHFPEYWYPNPEHPLAQVHRWLRTAFRDEAIEITSQTDDLRIAVARVSGPRTPADFYVVDVTERKVLARLPSRPALKPEQLALVEPIEFAARDGLKIRGYLTTPNVAVKKRLPTIVLVHGGPHGINDIYGFDYEAQLFASRGYAILQINYRGSAGRGRDFSGAGYGRWGREMQDDITDGVRWAIGDGVADAKRICIYGGSYGAYAALTGVFREPDLFRCAVGLAGVYDLPLMFEEGDIQTLQRGINYLRRAVGTDTEELKRRSPVYNADKIKAAVFLLHGKQDERAPYEHARRMRAALEVAGNAPLWFTESGEAHGFFGEENRRAAYAQILAFFDKHLGVSGAKGQ